MEIRSPRRLRCAYEFQALEGRGDDAPIPSPFQGSLHFVWRNRWLAASTCLAPTARHHF